jgi:serine/threonine protein phosphatase PrpC
MGTGGTTKPLSEDHKPTDEGEKNRIEAAGGTVSWKRVDGDLAVSRALGDFQYKTRPDLPAEQQKVGGGEE